MHVACNCKRVAHSFAITIAVTTFSLAHCHGAGSGRRARREASPRRCSLAGWGLYRVQSHGTRVVHAGCLLVEGPQPPSHTYCRQPSCRCRAVRLDWPHAAEQEAEVKAWDGTNKRVQLAVVYPAARRMVRPVVHTALSAPVAHQHSYVASHAPHCRQSVVPEHTSRFMRFGLIERMILGL